MDNRFFILPFIFDVDRLTHDLSICEDEQWTAHFNKKDYAGDWNGIALRSASGLATDIITISPDAFADTPLLEDCTYFREIIDQLKCPVETVRLLALSPGSTINEHRDMGLGYAYGRFRLHIPIMTDAAVSFVVDGCRIQMEAGQCWYADFSLPHSVHHGGTLRRIHLVIDGLRNEWTDRLFESAGYNFETEQRLKSYDHATKMGMIKQLRLMDTDTARAIIASLESDVDQDTSLAQEGNKTPGPPPEEGWIPVSLQNTAQRLSFNWIWMGDKPYTEPFFQDTLSRARTFDLHKNNAIRSSSLEQLHGLAQSAESLTPTAIVFHVSRCGSTLLSQLLCEDEENIVLSEVPLLDALLRLPYQDFEISQQLLDRTFKSVVDLLAQKRKFVQKHLYIKTDCWHIFFYKTFRRLFPDTPFLLLYRRPDEVIRSHQNQRGLQSIPNTLEPELTGIKDDQGSYADLDGYLIKLLEKIFSSFVNIQSQDSNTFLINYKEGANGMLRVLEKATGVSCADDTRRKMEYRSRFHAKRPTELFAEQSSTKIQIEGLQKVMALYDRLEGNRQ